MVATQKNPRAKARDFAEEWKRRNAAGNLSAGWIAEQGAEIENLVVVFLALDSTLTQVHGVLEV